MKEMAPFHMQEDAFEVSVEARGAQMLADLKNAREYAFRKSGGLYWNDDEIKMKQQNYFKEELWAKTKSPKLIEDLRTRLGLPPQEEPLPDPLPERFKGQCESTIRRMMRQEKQSVTLIGDFSVSLKAPTFTIKSE